MYAPREHTTSANVSARVPNGTVWRKGRKEMAGMMVDYGWKIC
jgi:hypothetical protein